MPRFATPEKTVGSLILYGMQNTGEIHGNLLARFAIDPCKARPDRLRCDREPRVSVPVKTEAPRCDIAAFGVSPRKGPRCSCIAAPESRTVRS